MIFGFYLEGAIRVCAMLFCAIFGVVLWKFLFQHSVFWFLKTKQFAVFYKF